MIAVGSSLGSISLHDVATNSTIAELEGHSGKVNSLSWANGTTSLFSCSSDKHIIEWDLFQHKIKRCAIFFFFLK